MRARTPSLQADQLTGHVPGLACHQDHRFSSVCSCASGVFSTAQQLGGAVGVALIGTIFFTSIATEGFTSAFQASMPLAIGAFIGCALLSLALPRTAVAEASE